MNANNLGAPVALARWVYTLCAIAACNTRDARLDVALPTNPATHALRNSVAIVDEPLNRVLLFRKEAQTWVETGKGIARTDSNGAQLFVLSNGEPVRKKPTDERPSLSIIDDAGLQARYDLPIARDALAIDPLGEYLALYSASTSGALIDNPNEILLVNLKAPPSDTNPQARTLRSFGGRPARVTFTEPVVIAGRDRRLLVVETEQDIALLDLSKNAPEVTVRLNTATSSHSLIPNGIVVDAEHARIAVKLKNETSILLLDLVADEGENDFTPHINLLDAGGGISDAAFLPTDAGLKVVALSGKQAVLIAPDTAARNAITLPAGYTRLSYLKNRQNVLLWGNGVALWDLGLATDRPFASVEALALSATVNTVTDVPSRPNLKLLGTTGETVYVLDLDKRTVAPLSTQGAISLAIGDQRVWAYKPGQAALSRVLLDTLEPKALFVDRRVNAVHEVDGSLYAIHFEDAVGITLFDAANPDDTAAVVYSNLLLGGLL